MIIRNTGLLTKMLNFFMKNADRVSGWPGKTAAWLMLPLILELVYDTVARYIFNAPTVWSFDISYMIYAILFMLGGAYTLRDEEHIRIEFLYERFSKRGQAFLDVICYLVFFFPPMLALLYFGIEFAADSWKILEHSTVSYWSPPLYHFKIVIPIGAFLLFLRKSSQRHWQKVKLMQY